MAVGWRAELQRGRIGRAMASARGSPATAVEWRPCQPRNAAASPAADRCAERLSGPADVERYALDQPSDCAQPNCGANSDGRPRVDVPWAADDRGNRALEARRPMTRTLVILVLFVVAVAGLH